MGFPLSFLAAGALWIEISHIVLLEQLKPVFLRFKEQVTFKFKNKYQGYNMKGRLIPFVTPVNSCWTIPLIE
jgi:hypothetical protein